MTAAITAANPIKTALDDLMRRHAEQSAEIKRLTASNAQIDMQLADAYTTLSTLLRPAPEKTAQRNSTARTPAPASSSATGRPTARSAVLEMLRSAAARGERWITIASILKATGRARSTISNILSSLIRAEMVRSRLLPGDVRGQTKCYALSEGLEDDETLHMTPAELRSKHLIASCADWRTASYIAKATGYTDTYTRGLLDALVRSGDLVAERMQQRGLNGGSDRPATHYAPPNTTIPLKLKLANLASAVKPERPPDPEALHLLQQLPDKLATTTQIARRSGVEHSLTFDLLVHLEAHGLVMCVNGQWKRTPTAGE